VFVCIISGSIADRLEAWRESGATTLVLQARQREALQALAELTA